MAKFVTERVFRLEFLGDEWKDCFIKFTSVSINEARDLASSKLTGKSTEEIVNTTLQFFRDHFISGNAYDAETKMVVALKPEDLGELPSVIQEKMIVFLIGDTKI